MGLSFFMLMIGSEMESRYGELSDGNRELNHKDGAKKNGNW